MVIKTQYDNKIAISIVNFVETTWLTRYPIPQKSRITKDQNSSVMSSGNPETMIRDHCQAKHFSKSNFQYDIGTDPTGSRNHST